jgi:hypothetical protein
MLLLSRDEGIKITEDVIKAAAENRRSGNESYDALAKLRQ